MAVSILSSSADAIAVGATDLARSQHHRQVDSKHLFCQLAMHDQLCREWLMAAGCLNPTLLARQLVQHLSPLWQDEVEHIPPSSLYIQVMLAAGDNATRQGYTEIQTSHLLEAIVAVDRELNDWLADEGYTLNVFAGEPSTVLIDQVCRDLTALAREGKLAPVQGREKELQSLVESLLNPGKRNVLLIGEAGVGKTAIVELLAQKVAEGTVPGRLRGLRLLELNSSLLVAGTTYRGQFEAKTQSLLDELQLLANAVIFIDEFHIIMSTGSTSEGGTTLANVLKPALARGQLRCIGATTRREYVRYVEVDRALARRFYVVEIGEPSPTETEAMLRVHGENLRRHFSLDVQDGVFSQIVELAGRYLTSRAFPDKAIDILSRCAAKAEVRRQPSIDNALVSEVVSEMAGVPVDPFHASVSERLLQLESTLATRVVGQEQALRIVADQLRASWAGLRSLDRPRAVFLLVGPSGVGKTLLASALADAIYQDKNALIRLDMSEYMERMNVSRLLGAAPGYIGHDNPGHLTEALRRRPHAVVLLDEIEKAHPDVINLFLQLFDEGRLTDSHGTTVDGRHAIFVMTSNVVAIQSSSEQLFIPGDNEAFRSDGSDLFLHAILRMHFRPELLNRVDRVVVFQDLTFASLTKIAEQRLSQIEGHLRDQHIQLTYSSEVVEYIVGLAVRNSGAARRLNGLIEESVVFPLSQFMLKAKVQNLSLHLSLQGGQIEVEQRE